MIIQIKAMILMRGVIIFILSTSTFLIGWSQAPKKTVPDSLLHLLNQHRAKDTTRVVLLNQVAFMHYFTDPVRSLNHAFEARAIADSLQFTRGEADAFRQIGLTFWAQADIPTAIKYYFTGLKIAETHHHQQVQADITASIGTAYIGMGNAKEALGFLNQSRDLQRQLNNTKREAAVLNNIGDAHLALKELDKATAAYTSALQAAENMGYTLGISANLRNLANVFEQQGKYDTAIALYVKCIDLSSSISDDRGRVLSYKSLASAYLKKNKYDESGKYAREGLEVARKAKLRAVARDLYEVLYKINEISGNQLQAFAYFKLFSAYRDSVQNLHAVTEVDGHRLRFETEKKQSEIELLKKDSQLKSSQLILSSVISVLLILLLTFGIRNFKRVRRHNLVLSEKNKQIEQQHFRLTEQNDELSTLNEEIRAQQEEVMAQRDSLEEKNAEIQKVNQQMAEVNENLEHLVDQRTRVLEEQNQKLSEYAFFNAHKLRAPLARVMGLVNLLFSKTNSGDQPVILSHLKTSSEELDNVVRSISNTLHEGMNVFPAKKEKEPNEV